MINRMIRGILYILFAVLVLTAIEAEASELDFPAPDHNLVDEYSISSSSKVCVYNTPFGLDAVEIENKYSCPTYLEF